MKTTFNEFMYETGVKKQCILRKKIPKFGRGLFPQNLCKKLWCWLIWILVAQGLKAVSIE
jgi:hypothetical protein